MKLFGKIKNLFSSKKDEEEFEAGYNEAKAAEVARKIIEDHNGLNADHWYIVRYFQDGGYDCMWSGPHTVREAIKRCRELQAKPMYQRVYVLEDIRGYILDESLWKYIL